MLSEQFQSFFCQSLFFPDILTDELSDTPLFPLSIINNLEKGLYFIRKEIKMKYTRISSESFNFSAVSLETRLDLPLKLEHRHPTCPAYYKN